MILGDLFFGMTKYSIGNIAHFAHVGGALIGFIIAWYWKKNQFKTALMSFIDNIKSGYTKRKYCRKVNLHKSCNLYFHLIYICFSRFI